MSMSLPDFVSALTKVVQNSISATTSICACHADTAKAIALLLKSSFTSRSKIQPAWVPGLGASAHKRCQQRCTRCIEARAVEATSTLEALSNKMEIIKSKVHEDPQISIYKWSGVEPPSAGLKPIPPCNKPTITPSTIPPPVPANTPAPAPFTQPNPLIFGTMRRQEENYDVRQEDHQRKRRKIVRFEENDIALATS
jgi:hypothetical protein